MVFKPSQKRTSYNIQILINDQKIDQVKEIVFLGVIIDEKLTGSGKSLMWPKKSRSL